MRRLRDWPWYTRIAASLWLLTVAALAFALTVPLLDAFAVLMGRAWTMPTRASWPMPMAAGITAITLGWQHFFVPLFASASVRFTERRTPRMMLRNFWVSLWMPCIVASIICVTNFIPVYVGRHTLDQWLVIQPWILYVVALVPFLTIPPLMLMWPVRRRLKINAGEQARCFECGYHLMGVWSSQCPECGSPRFDIEMETSGDPTEPVSA